MRQSFLFLVLALPMLAFGQPIEGPFVVLEAGEAVSFKDPHIVLRADSLADIFYVQNSAEVRFVSFSLVSQSVVSGPEVLFPQEGWTQDIVDVENQSDGSWAVGLHSQCRLNEHYEYSALVIMGNHDSVNTNELAHVYCDDPDMPYSCSWIQNLGVTGRMDGGWIAGWILGEIVGPYYEPGYFPYVTFFQSSEPEDTVEVYSQSFLYGPTGARALSLAPDTVLILLSQVEGFGWIEGSAIKIVSRPEDPFAQPEAVLPCTESNLDFRRTHSGRLLVFSGIDEWHPEYPHPRIVEVDTSGNCVELYTFPFDREPDAIAWHPDYGFAALLVHPARIMLARIDTNGVEVQPLGIFWEPTDGHRISGANLTINDSGQVVVLWTELSEADSVIMKIGSVGWTTFLGVEENRTKTIPERISLSTYPNPFNLTATISFELPRAQEISVVIYDVLGRRVCEIARGMQTAGNHELRFDASGLSSGIYFVRLKAGDFAVAKKVLLLK
jgi:hypothetical protein